MLGVVDGRNPRPPDRAAAQRRADPADDRESPAGAREQEQDARAQASGAAFDALEQRTRATIERSRALLAASSHRHGGKEAAAAETERLPGPDHAEAGRPATENAEPAAPDPGRQVERARALRSQALAAIAAFAATEEEIARIHDDLAARHPGRRDEHHEIAGHARAAARKAQEIMRDFAD